MPDPNETRRRLADERRRAVARQKATPTIETEEPEKEGGLTSILTGGPLSKLHDSIFGKMINLLSAGGKTYEKHKKTIIVLRSLMSPCCCWGCAFLIALIIAAGVIAGISGLLTDAFSWIAEQFE